MIQKRYQEFDVAVDQLFTKAREEGHLIPCKQGCDACCYDVALLTQMELPPLIEAIRAMSPSKRAAVKEGIREWATRARAAGIDLLTTEPDMRTYHEAHLACPLLDRERHECSVYAARPLCCRAHHVVNVGPAACAGRATDPFVPSLDHAAIVTPFLQALFTDNAEEGEDLRVTMGLLPTMLALCWPVIEHPERSIEKWLVEVCRKGLQATMAEKAWSAE